MFPYLLAHADPKHVLRWRIATGVAFGVGGGVSIATIVPHIKAALPTGMIIEQFTHMAAAIAFIAGLPLVFFPRVLSVSLAQLGVATSLMFLACSFGGAFPETYTPFIRGFLAIVACVLLALFSSGIGYFIRRRSPSDIALSIVLLIPFVLLWLFPITHPLK